MRKTFLASVLMLVLLAGLCLADTTAVRFQVDVLTAAPMVGQPTGFKITALNATGGVATDYDGTEAGYALFYDARAMDGVDNINPFGESSFDRGVCTFDVEYAYSGAGTLVVKDSRNMAITGQSSSFTIAPGPAEILSLTAPTAAVKGTTFQVQVKAHDGYGNALFGKKGNIATGYKGYLKVTCSDPTTSVPMLIIAQAGRASFNATVRTSGVQTFTVVDKANPLLKATAQVTVK